MIRGRLRDHNEVGGLSFDGPPAFLLDKTVQASDSGLNHFFYGTTTVVFTCASLGSRSRSADILNTG